MKPTSWPGRIGAVSDNATHGVTYGYLDNAGLIETQTHQRGSMTIFSADKDFDGLNRLTKIDRTLGTQTVAYGYDTNLADQRTKMTKTTNATEDWRWNFGYDALGQLNEAKKRVGESGPYIPGHQYVFDYDDIGNRNQVQCGGDQNEDNLSICDYTPNLLNQYTQRTFPTPTPTQTFAHDADGNLEDDGQWTYIWDAENRLRKMTKSDDSRYIEFTYDYLGRRTTKTVYDWDAEEETFIQSNQTRYVYDGWNLIGELCADNTPNRAYVWGPDLSGSLQGAGGIGGLALLRQYESPTAWKVHSPVFDGNGNAVELIQVSEGSGSGTTTASYEYSPYGQVLTSTGSYASTNPIRFSTKYTDTETGLAYFGYRYYNSDTGRWTNRDPIEEQGGLTLYGYVANSPPNHYDPVGLLSEYWEDVEALAVLNGALQGAMINSLPMTHRLLWRYLNGGGDYKLSNQEMDWILDDEGFMATTQRNIAVIIRPYRSSSIDYKGKELLNYPFDMGEGDLFSAYHNIHFKLDLRGCILREKEDVTFKGDVTWHFEDGYGFSNPKNDHRMPFQDRWYLPDRYQFFKEGRFRRLEERKWVHPFKIKGTLTRTLELNFKESPDELVFQKEGY